MHKNRDNIESTHLGFAHFVLVTVFLDFNPAHQKMTWYLPALFRLDASQPFWFCPRLSQRYLPRPHLRMHSTHFPAFFGRPVVQLPPALAQKINKNHAIFVSLFGGSMHLSLPKKVTTVTELHALRDHRFLALRV